jgi:hypothetical protein
MERERGPPSGRPSSRPFSRSCSPRPLNRQVREGGLEPPRDFSHTALNRLARVRSVSASVDASAVLPNLRCYRRVPFAQCRRVSVARESRGSWMGHGRAPSRVVHNSKTDPRRHRLRRRCSQPTRRPECSRTSEGHQHHGQRRTPRRGHHSRRGAARPDAGRAATARRWPPTAHTEPQRVTRPARSACRCSGERVRHTRTLQNCDARRSDDRRRDVAVESQPRHQGLSVHVSGESLRLS